MVLTNPLPRRDMSIFYLSPVKGDIHIHLLETIVIERLNYLKAVIKGQAFVYNEYVVDGSVYDIVGHYMLCIVALLIEDRVDFTRFIINAEDILFKSRLNSLSSYDLRCFAKKLRHTLKKQPKVQDFMVPLRILCQHLMLRDIAHHICNKCHDSCSLYNLNVNFKHCLAFVATKQVALKNGTAYIPCSKWKPYLLLLFNANLSTRLYDTDLNNLKDDPRIIELLYKIESIARPWKCKSGVELKSNDIDSIANMFPPCMLNLHQHLRKRHRLTHNQRFFYTLFLKDLGMSIDEAVIFWRNEYRQAPNGISNCCHNWDKDAKKFIYGIRHMYGLEGRKKQYICRSCKQIQSSDTSYSKGGCPFKSFDSENMRQILNLQNTGMSSQIEEFKGQGKYTSACLIYLQNKIAEKAPNKSCNLDYFNFTPVKYYSIVRNASNLCI